MPVTLILPKAVESVAHGPRTVRAVTTVNTPAVSRIFLTSSGAAAGGCAAPNSVPQSAGPPAPPGAGLAVGGAGAGLRNHLVDVVHRKLPHVSNGIRSLRRSFTVLVVSRVPIAIPQNNISLSGAPTNSSTAW